MNSHLFLDVPFHDELDWAFVVTTGTGEELSLVGVFPVAGPKVVAETRPVVGAEVFTVLAPERQTEHSSSPFIIILR